LRTHEGVAHWRRFLRDAAHLVVEFGGSLSGEHGDGQAKAEFLPIMYGDELVRAMGEFKALWDPNNKMNPGKVVNSYRADENLRLGPDYRPVPLTTRLAFRTLEGSGFVRQMDRCVGTGRCRAQHDGTMCPSYRATREERDSTRGRARLLYEMVRAETVTDGWESEPVRQALDTCLSCKGCKRDCPTHTDMASYKAEFLSHYHETRARPRQMIFFANIGRWAPWASRIAALSNFVTQTPGLSSLIKWIAGIAQARRLPRLARRSFSAAVADVAQPDRFDRTVLLWVDTFSEYFQPHVAMSAVKVLNAAGCRVVFPSHRLCCGRPYYDAGMLDRAKAQLEDILSSLDEQIEGDVPVVGLEPSCLSVFKDELLQFFPDDPRAKRLAAQTYLLADYLNRIEFTPPALGIEVTLHGHCHQKSVFSMAGEVELLRKMGINTKRLENGCCGMAGGFGFDRRHYDMSQRIGEHEFFPALRAAANGAPVVTSGFSCREQASHAAPSQPVLHIAELLERAIEKGK
jgi:Fe-S oxidoreductase